MRATHERFTWKLALQSGGNRLRRFTSKMILSKLYFTRNSLVAGRRTFWEGQVRRQHEQVRGDRGLSALGVGGGTEGFQ